MCYKNRLSLTEQETDFAILYCMVREVWTSNYFDIFTNVFVGIKKWSPKNREEKSTPKKLFFFFRRESVPVCSIFEFLYL